MPADQNQIAPLGREEYVEQAHFFRSLGERLRQNVPMQEVLGSVREEVLATTKLPLAIDFLQSELRHAGAMGTAMGQLGHYFTPLQAYVVQAGEDERGRFDLRIGLDILRFDAEYRAGVHSTTGLPPSRQGLFFFQFEAICRNRLSYDHGLAAMAADSAFDEPWRAWLAELRRKVGMVDLADLIYVSSEHYQRRKGEGGRGIGQQGDRPGDAPLFGDREGRIALANRRKDPLMLFASLHRHLGYPAVPRPETLAEEEDPVPQIARRLEQLEKRIKLLEEEQRGGIDLTQFYGPPES